jgi:hypothetical protein
MLSQLVTFTLSLVGSELTLIGHKMIEMSFCHPSLRRIILSKSEKPRSHSSYKTPPVKLVFPSVKLVYVSDDFHSRKVRQLRYKTGNGGFVHLEPEYHVRCLDLDFNNWNVYMLDKLLPNLPLLTELKVKGCGQTPGWLRVNIWDQMLQNLKALQRVAIDIAMFCPSQTREKIIRDFNEKAAQRLQTCKRINLTVGPQDFGCFRFRASLNMD